MTFHRQILQWQADHPVITWIFWIVVWMLVLLVLLKADPAWRHDLTSRLSDGKCHRS